MPLRRSIPALLALLVAGCQDYNFNPVGKCVIQPGSAQIKLASTGTADLLFVVDDSGSMASEQASLARNFGQFIAALKQLQAQRAADKLEPYEFHIAITTSSIFEGWLPTSGAPTCSGQPLQCNISSSYYTHNPTSLACSTAGASCDDLVENYFPSFTGVYACSAGVASPGAGYPQGSFVAATGNPKVLHFTKDVWTGTADAEAKLAQLSGYFQQNINVGTCGSGMEQHFESGRLAVEKALAGAQPGVTAGEWPHSGAKLVTVFLGDEDDCSNPSDPTLSLAFDPKNLSTQNPGSDVCVADQNASTHKMFPLDRYVSYFTGLARPFGAAFVYSAQLGSCKDDGGGNVVCTAGTCSCACPSTCTACNQPGSPPECQIPGDCSGKIAFLSSAQGDVVDGVQKGSRYAAFSALLRDKGVNTFEASVCDANWGTTLQGIAQLVKPPPGLTLPTQPAASQVALLRIESSDGRTSRYCDGPDPTKDWYFVNCKTGAALPAGQTSDASGQSCIAINHATGHCEPNAGESYIAQYLGIVPPPSATNARGGCDPAQNGADCAAALGGQAGTWQCTAVSSGSTSGPIGTCTCGG